MSNIYQLKHYINGEFVDSSSGLFFDDINPATEEKIADVALGNNDDIKYAATCAKNTFDSGVWSDISLNERAEILNKIGDLILENKQALALAETKDTGKPIMASLNVDIPRSAQNFHFFAKFLTGYKGDVYSNNKDQIHLALREPLGVVGLITPWNLPLYLSTWKIAPALAMGNSIILKPAELSPLTASLFCDIIAKSGLPDGVFNVVHGYGPDSAGEALTLNSDINAISFTGETITGKAIMKNASSTLKKVSFELGGKGANVIFEDADLAQAIPAAVRAAFTNQGQICLAGSRLFVHENMYDKVVRAIKTEVENLIIGDPIDTKTIIGSLIGSEHCEKVFEYINIGKESAKLEIGGNRIKINNSNNFIEPTIFSNIKNDSQLCQQEIFGPVLPIIKFKSDDEVLQMVNSTQYGLSASIWSQNVNRCNYFARRIQAGIIWVNCWFVRELATPFGGQKSSGIGREGGRYSLEFFSEAKTVTYKFN